MARSKRKSGSDSYYETIEGLLTWVLIIGSELPEFPVNVIMPIGGITFEVRMTLDSYTLYNGYYILQNALLYVHKRYVKHTKLETFYEAKNKHYVDSVTQALSEIDRRGTSNE